MALLVPLLRPAPPRPPSRWWRGGAVLCSLFLEVPPLWNTLYLSSARTWLGSARHGSAPQPRALINTVLQFIIKTDLEAVVH